MSDAPSRTPRTSDAGGLNRPAFYHVDDVTIDLAHLRVFKGGTLVHMEPRALSVLIYLVEHRDRLVHKSELLDQLWGGAAVSESALTRVIADLRRTLGDDAREPHYIETAHRLGYRFLAEVTPSGGSDAASLAAAVATPTVTPTDVDGSAEAQSRATDPGSRRTHVFVRYRWLIIAAAAVLLLTGAVAMVVTSRESMGAAELAPLNARAERTTTSGGLDHFPSYSPDGQWLAYSSNRQGSFELEVMSLIDSGPPRQITVDGNENVQPAWSPDGKRLAFHSIKRRGIWIVPASGGEATQLCAFGSRPAWSKDGQWIAFQSDTLADLSEQGGTAMPSTTIGIVSPNGGETRQVTRPERPAGGHGGPTWSPNGQFLVFTTYLSGRSQLMAIDVDGTNLRAIDCGSALCSDPVFAPDGKALYYGVAQPGPVSEIWRLRLAANGVATGAPVAIAVLPGNTRHKQLAVSPDGRELAYSLISTLRNLWELPLQPNAAPMAPPRALTSDTSGNFMPAFSPDGKRLVFVSSRNSRAELHVMDLATRVTTPVGIKVPAIFPGFTADGRGLIFSAALGDVERIMTAAPDGSGARTWPVEIEANHPRLSPSGDRLAFDSAASGRRQVWTADLASGMAQQVTTAPGSVSYPCWSPRGDQLAVQIRREAHTYLGIVPSRGGHLSTLVDAPGHSWAGGWSPDGDKIVFAGSRDGRWNIWWVSLSTREQRQLTDNGRTGAYVRYPAWSPDGQRIVYEQGETFGNIWRLALR